MTFSAPKSVSVLWALSERQHRQEIERTHQEAVATATRQLEQTAAWARRGKGGAIREQTAGLLTARFDHYTSRDLDPQLHTHSFIFNLAPRQDGTWGAIVSRDLYKAQKEAGATYRNELANGLERLGYRLDRDKEGFRVAAIPRSVERAFSKRRQAIEQAVETHGYKTAKGMEMAALRTRRAKQDVSQDQLFKTWEAEANGLGFRLTNSSNLSSAAAPPVQHSPPKVLTRPPAHAPVPVPAATVANVAHTLAYHISRLGRALSQPAAMPGVRVRLRGREHERD
jgi:conjugative relaxase-like TrwC/TraI family protein